MSKMIFVIYGLLSALVKNAALMYIEESMKIEEKYCNLIPANSTIPCREFTIPDPLYCTESKLDKLFPELYKQNDPDSPVSWPGQIKNLPLEGRQATWNVAPDGNVYFLKGFQVIKVGNSMDTFGLKLCSVIDLSNLTKSDFKDLLQTTFVVDNNSTGSFLVEIKPLPLAPEELTETKESDLLPDPANNKYHPDMTVKVEYTQTNASTLNISVEIHSHDDKADFQQFYVQIMTAELQLVETAPSLFNTSKQYFFVSGLADGNYTLKLIPVDPYEFDFEKCLCYYGIPDSRLCTPCNGYTKSLQVIDISRKIRKPPFVFHDVAPQSLLG